MDEIVGEFLVESYENLDRLDADLLALEEDPSRPDLLASIFRSIHTIKGTCRFLGYAKLERVAHVGESLLSRLRDGELVLTPEITTALLRLVDAVRLMLASVEANGSDGDGDWSDLVAQLEALQQRGAPSVVPAPTDAVAVGVLAPIPPRLAVLLVRSSPQRRQRVLTMATGWVSCWWPPAVSRPTPCSWPATPSSWGTSGGSARCSSTTVRRTRTR